MSDEHPIFARLEMLKSNLAMRFMRVHRAGDTALADALLGKIAAVEVVEKIAHDEYETT